MYYVCRLKESCKKNFSRFLTTNSLFFFLHEWKYHSILKLVFLLDESGFERVQSSTYWVWICLKFVILFEFDSTLSQMFCGKIKYYPKNPSFSLKQTPCPTTKNYYTILFFTKNYYTILFLIMHMTSYLHYSFS